MNHLTQRRQTYFQQSNELRFCAGSKNECAELAADGYQVIDWDAEVDPRTIASIKLLHLVPTKQQLKKAKLPAFISRLVHLESLVLDLSFLRNLQADELPGSLRSLTLVRDLRYLDLIQDFSRRPVSWKDTIVLPRLEALMLVADDEKSGFLRSIAQRNFPSLRFLGFSLSDASELQVFEKFEQLSDVEVIRLGDCDVFTRLGALPLVSVSLGGTRQKFDLSPIKGFKTLEMVSLNGVRAEIDCEIFTELPGLRELSLLNSKKIKNIEALLGCPGLEHLRCLDCGNPFKKGIAQKFESRGFARLDIRFA